MENTNRKLNLRTLDEEQRVRIKVGDLIPTTHSF